MTDSSFSNATSHLLTTMRPQPSESLESFDRAIEYTARDLGVRALTSKDAIRALASLRDAREYAARAFDPRTDAERMSEAASAYEEFRATSAALAAELEELEETSDSGAEDTKTDEVSESETPGETERIEAAEDAPKRRRFSDIVGDSEAAAS